MSGRTITNANVTTTWSAPQGIPMYVRRDGEAYIVTDVIGSRLGWGKCIAHALEDWICHVEHIFSIPDEELGEPLRSEVARYRQAINRPTGPT